MSAPETPALPLEWPNHAAAWREWRAALAGTRMHHGWILAGKSGLGKRAFSAAAARELVASEGAPSPDAHPDIITLTHGPRNDKEARAAAEGKPYERARSIRVDQVRTMQKRLTTRPTLGERRAIVIDPADDLEVSAANALLKSLEEPPAGTFFLLVTHSPSRLLPTIRSRCRMLRFPVLRDQELAAMLDAAEITATPEARRAAVEAADGSLGAAIRFAEQELAPMGGLIRNILSAGDRDLSQRADLARMIGPRPDRERLQAVLDLAQRIVADAARSTASHAHRAQLADLYGELGTLAAKAPTYNFDTGLLTLEIGGLLARAAPASEPAHGR
ncbi:DNA polymerase III subunit delta' [Erythrobacter sp.]|jgi:DNA polymerase-3 subunit delta'|uniref:DNA polymerase III subunit delta' n=1 Tax=Erythrobacter sp. TaxID=1042 RepID=UPI002EC1B69B|nr:DNA polymerase III subunit delta' [Erythrobacter sp.]